VRHWTKIIAMAAIVMLAVAMVGPVVTRAAGVAEDDGENCSTLAVGEKVSVTGSVIVGHNEDNGGLLVMPAYWVERQTHGAGEVIVFGDSKVQIPQVEQTWAYGWSETRAIWGGSFSDGFINEWGVSIVSNNCSKSKEDKPELLDGGIGYGLRTLMAQRGKSAREAVEIGVDLVDTYGYNSSGRTYTIADKDEVWLLEVVYGKHCLAERVPDNEVAYIPNHYTIRNVDLNDTKNFIGSPDVITYAIERGWYTPAKSGHYSDFDFAKVYQAEASWRTAGNVDRHYNAIRLLTNTSWSQEYKNKELPFSFKPYKKVGIDDVKKVLRSHYEGTPDDKSNGYTIDPNNDGIRTICTSTTRESAIFEYNKDINLTVYWRASGHPDTSVYQPWYILASHSVPNGYGWIDPAVGFATHFNVPPEDLSYNPDRAWWSFEDLQTIVDLQYGTVISTTQQKLFNLENQWEKVQPIVEEMASSGKSVPSLVDAFLSNYTNIEAQRAWDLVKQLYNELATVKCEVMSNTLSISGIGNVDFVVFSDNNFQAAQIDPSTIIIGPGYVSTSSWSTSIISSKLEDKNGDEVQDLVLTFKNEDLVKNLYPVYTSLWLKGKTTSGDIFVTRDLIQVIK
jgi:dipeptidase